MEPEKTFISSVVLNLGSKKQPTKTDRVCEASSISKKNGKVSAIVGNQDLNVEKHGGYAKQFAQRETAQQRDYSHIYNDIRQQQISQKMSAMELQETCSMEQLACHASSMKREEKTMQHRVHFAVEEHAESSTIAKEEKSVCSEQFEHSASLLEQEKFTSDSMCSAETLQGHSTDLFKMEKKSVYSDQFEHSTSLLEQEKFTSDSMRSAETLQGHSADLFKIHSTAHSLSPLSSHDLSRSSNMVETLPPKSLEKVDTKEKASFGSQVESHLECLQESRSYAKEMIVGQEQIGYGLQACFADARYNIDNYSLSESAGHTSARSTYRSGVLQNTGAFSRSQATMESSNAGNEHNMLATTVDNRGQSSTGQFNAPKSIGIIDSSYGGVSNQGTLASNSNEMEKINTTAGLFTGRRGDNIEAASTSSMASSSGQVAHGGSTEFTYHDQLSDGACSPQVVSVFRGHVKLKSKAFESNKSPLSTQVSSFSDMSSEVNGFVQEGSEARHESQIVGDDALEIDGHVRLKQNLFETLPVEALYEHGLTHSSQVITRGRRKSNLDEVLNDFNTKKMDELNENEKIEPEKDFVNFSVSDAVMSIKESQSGQALHKDELHESRRVDADIPYDNTIVKENSDRFKHADFCYKTQYCSSQSVTEEERVAAAGLITSMKGEFENKPLDFIGLDERPARHQSQLIEDEHMSRSGNDNEDFVLSEPHSSQQVNFIEEISNGLTEVREKRRQYYEYCNSPTQFTSKELLEDSEILNSPEMSGIVKNTASVYLENVKDRIHGDKIRKFRNDVYVKPMRSKFETQSISDLGKSTNLHSSQCTSSPELMSEETQQVHRSEAAPSPTLHTSQIVDPAEYKSIRSSVGNMKQVFTFGDKKSARTETPILTDYQVGPMKRAFETGTPVNESTLHSSQIVGHDIHVINNIDEGHSLSEVSELHESQKVNYGIVRSSTKIKDVEENVFSRQNSSEAVRNGCFSKRALSRNSVKSARSLEDDEKDLSLLLNYTPMVIQELPSMVSVMSKGVSDEIIRSGHSVATEYITDSKTGKRIHVGSGCSTPLRKSSTSSNPVFTGLDASQQQQKSKSYQGYPYNDRSSSVDPFTDFVQPNYHSLDFDASAENDYDDSFLPPPPAQLQTFDQNTEDFIPYESGDYIPGSSVFNPSGCNNVVTAPDAELPFFSVEHENSLREKFSKHTLKLYDDDTVRRISRATVESYTESDDQLEYIDC